MSPTKLRGDKNCLMVESRAAHHTQGPTRASAVQDRWTLHWRHHASSVPDDKDAHPYPTVGTRDEDSGCCRSHRELQMGFVTLGRQQRGCRGWSLNGQGKLTVARISNARMAPVLSAFVCQPLWLFRTLSCSWRKQHWNIKGQGKQSELEPVVYLQDSGEWA